MHKNTLAFVIVALLAGFIGGFWLANSINRSALNTIGSQKVPAAGANTAVVQSNTEQDLSPDEIRSKIAEADKNPANYAYQKDLGIALYRYAAMKKDDGLLAESARILERAASLDPKDFDVLVAYGNARFDIGFAKRDAASFQSARDNYTRALEIKPTDPDVRTDFGLTYIFQDPPAYDKAVAELQKVIDANPRHGRSLQFLVQALVKQNKLAEADKALATLKALEPANPAIGELTSQITDARGGAAK